MKKALTLVVVLAMASAAQAAIIGSQGGDIDAVVSYVGPATGAGGVALDVYNVALVDVGSTVDTLNAVDVVIAGQLYQVSAFGGAIATPDMQFASMLGADMGTDTHFLVWNVGAASYPQWQATVTPAAEDNDGSLGPTAGGGLAGWGTALSVISTYINAGDIVLAQVAVPAGAGAALAGSCSDVTGEVFQLSVPIPEPATMSLLLLGGLGLVARKRR